MKTQVRFSTAISVVALVAALCGVGGAYAGSVIITSKQIKNGTILSTDIHKAGVKSTDVANGTISSADIGNGDVTSTDIGANQVTPADVSMPAPLQVIPPTASGPVTTEGFSKLADVATYSKAQSESVLEVNWSGAVTSGPGTNCIFQLRVDGNEPSGGGGEVFAQATPVNVATSAQFTGLAAGDVTVQIWAKATAIIGPGGSCVIGPSNPSIDTTIGIVEQIV